MNATSTHGANKALKNKPSGAFWVKTAKLDKPYHAFFHGETHKIDYQWFRLE